MCSCSAPPLRSVLVRKVRNLPDVDSLRFQQVYPYRVLTVDFVIIFLPCCVPEFTCLALPTPDSSNVGVRLGFDGVVACPNGNSVYRVQLYAPDAPSTAIQLYNRGRNDSTDQYVVTEDLTSVLVKNMAYSDAGEYRCKISHSRSRVLYSSTTLHVNGR